MTGGQTQYPSAARPRSQPRLVTAMLLNASLVMLAGCNLAPPFAPPQPKLPETFKTDGPWRTAMPKDDAARGDWWRLFRDARLTRLMQQAESGNPTLEVAVHRVIEARALARADHAGLLPTAALRSTAQRTRNTGTLQNQFAGGSTRTNLRAVVDLDYELDLWGRLRNQARAGQARANAVEADYFNVLLSLQSELAANYFELQAQDAEIALLRRTVDLRRRTLDLARTRFREGDIAQIDVAQAETELASTESIAIGLQRRRAELEHAIALLLGRTPAEFDLPAMDLEGGPPAVPASVPSDLLERRPDIAAAERNMAAANAEIGVARAALFPSVRIGVYGGGETSFIEQITRTASRVWGLGPAAIDWPIFDGGKRRADAEAAKARYMQTAATYRETVLKAVREVEDALSGLAILKRQFAAQQATVVSARRALQLAQERYDAGLVAYYEVLDGQRTLLQSEQQATRIQGEQFLMAVRLIKALGGGW